MTPKASLASFAAFSLWMGIVGFGGGWAVSQRIKRTVVLERQWLSEVAFVETFSVSSALPGTTATNLLTMLGAALVGLPGAVVGAIGFLTPSVALMIAFGASYTRLREVHALADLRLEARLFGPHLVGANWQGKGSEIARVIGDNGSRGAGFQVPDGYGHALHAGAGWILDSP